MVLPKRQIEEAKNLINNAPTVYQWTLAREIRWIEDVLRSVRTRNKEGVCKLRYSMRLDDAFCRLINAYRDIDKMPISETSKRQRMLAWDEANLHSLHESVSKVLLSPDARRNFQPHPTFTSEEVLPNPCEA